MKNLFFTIVGTVLISSSSFAINPIKKIEEKKETVNTINVSVEKSDKKLSAKSVTDNQDCDREAPRSITCWVAWVFGHYCVD